MAFLNCLWFSFLSFGSLSILYLILKPDLQKAKKTDTHPEKQLLYLKMILIFLAYVSVLITLCFVVFVILLNTI